MSAKILDGKKLSDSIALDLKRKIAKLKNKPALAIVQIGSNKESNAYISRKKSFGNSIGARVFHFVLPMKIKNDELIKVIEELNMRNDIHGIIVQLPLPKHLDRFKVMEAIDPKKDVDGLSSKNASLLYEGAFGGQDPKKIPQGIVPATAKGVLRLLKENKIALEGKRALVIGRSLLVGKPIAMLLIRENATVTIAHRKTKDLERLARENEIIIVGAGTPKLLGKKTFVKGQVIVDVGTNAVTGPKTHEEIPKMKMVGDVDFEEAKKIVKAISPVPGGVGPMTVASLFENLLEAYNRKITK